MIGKIFRITWPTTATNSQTVPMPEVARHFQVVTLKAQGLVFVGQSPWTIIKNSKHDIYECHARKTVKGKDL